MRFLFIIILISFVACKKESITSQSILEKSIKKHDPKNNIEKLKFKLRIQEPRLNNPVRFSDVMLDNKTGEFVLERNRDSFISTHKIDKNGIGITYLNNKIITDSLLIKKYRLDPLRNVNYRKYYQIFTLLPMSLQSVAYTLNPKFSEVSFNKKNAYKLTIELKDPVFSEHWNLYFLKNDFTFLGGKINYPNKPNEGEKIAFEGIIKINDILIPRFHHWYDFDNKYLGSDVIVKEIK